MNQPATKRKYLLSLEARTRSPDSFRAIKVCPSLEAAKGFLKDRFDLSSGVMSHHIQDDRVTGHIDIEGFRRLYVTIEPIEVLE